MERDENGDANDLEAVHRMFQTAISVNKEITVQKRDTRLSNQDLPYNQIAKLEKIGKLEVKVNEAGDGIELHRK